MAGKNESDLIHQLEEEIQAGREIGTELINRALKGEVTEDEYVSRMSELSPAQRAGAREVVSLVLKTNEALSRITSGAATIELDLPPDEAGYYDRRCPQCHSSFKVLYEDWISKNFKEVRCPICGHQADHNLFDTPTQREHVEFKGQKLVEREIAREFQDTRFHVSPADGAIPRDIAVKIERVLERGSECEQCGCRYATLTHPFFCPACGHRSARSAFKTGIEAVNRALQAIPQLRAELTASNGEQAAEDIIQRTLIEPNFINLVGAFQSAAEAAFLSLPNPLGLVARKNQFQNLKESSDLWKSVTGHDFPSMTSPAEWQDLQRLFQQRHKLAHTGGVVDQDYITKTGDTRYLVGDRIVVNEAAVLRLAELVSKLVEELQ